MSASNRLEQDLDLENENLSIAKEIVENIFFSKLSLVTILTIEDLKILAKISNPISIEKLQNNINHIKTKCTKRFQILYYYTKANRCNSPYADIYELFMKDKNFHQEFEGFWLMTASEKERNEIKQLKTKTRNEYFIAVKKTSDNLLGKVNDLKNAIPAIIRYFELFSLMIIKYTLVELFLNKDQKNILDPELNQAIKTYLAYLKTCKDKNLIPILEKINEYTKKNTNTTGEQNIECITEIPVLPKRSFTDFSIDTLLKNTQEAQTPSIKKIKLN